MGSVEGLVVGSSARLTGHSWLRRLELPDTLKECRLLAPPRVGDVRVIWPFPCPSVLRCISACLGIRKSLPSSMRGFPCTTMNTCWQGVSPSLKSILTVPMVYSGWPSAPLSCPTGAWRSRERRQSRGSFSSSSVVTIDGAAPVSASTFPAGMTTWFTEYMSSDVCRV